MSEKPYAALRAKGIAVGWSDIKDDSMTFEFGKEIFRFPALEVMPGIAKFNGYFYTARVKDLRALQKKKNGKSHQKKENLAA